MNEQGLLTFDDGKKKGNVGQQLAKVFFNRINATEAKDSEEFLNWAITTFGPEKCFLDTTGNTNYYEPDIDYVYSNRLKNIIVKIEVKTDYVTYYTHNIFFENDLTQHKGWGLRSQADLIFYYVICPNNTYELYILRLNELRQYVKEHPELKEKGSDKKADYVRGKLVNLNELLKLGIAKRIE